MMMVEIVVEDHHILRTGRDRTAHLVLRRVVRDPKLVICEERETNIEECREKITTNALLA